MVKQDNQSIIIYEIKRGKKISVPIKKETVWLSQQQMASLFDKDVNTIGEHIGYIYKENELKQRATTRKFRAVQLEGNREVSRNLDHYNLDVIISVGYRVKSLRGTQFRIWATKTLRDHILKGYTVNKSRLQSVGIDELERAVNLVRKTMEINLLKSDEAKGILRVISDYTHSWVLLHKYDEGHLELATKTTPQYELSHKMALQAISELQNSLSKSKSAAKFFGIERDDHGLERILGAINQTYNNKLLYKSVEEQAAHLLYFVIKDHPLIDGNKRSGALLFLHYLAENGRLFKKSGERRFNDNALVALTLLIAVSTPSDKDLLIKLITQLLVNE